MHRHGSTTHYSKRGQTCPMRHLFMVARNHWLERISVGSIWLAEVEFIRPISERPLPKCWNSSTLPLSISLTLKVCTDDEIQELFGDVTCSLLDSYDSVCLIHWCPVYRSNSRNPLINRFRGGDFGHERSNSIGSEGGLESQSISRLLCLQRHRVTYMHLLYCYGRYVAQSKKAPAVTCTPHRRF